MSDPVRPPEQVVADLIAAIGRYRIDDVLALVDPHVTWRPVTRPGLSEYHGHTGVAQFVADLFAAYDGRFRIVIEEIITISPTEVHLRVHAVQETDSGDKPRGPSVLGVYTIHDGKVTSLESEPAEPS